MNENVSQERLIKVRAELAKRGLDGYFATHSENMPNYNVRFLTGFSGSTAIIVISESEASIITDGRYFEQVAQEVAGFTLKKLPPGVLYSDYLTQVVGEMGIKSLGFDSASTTVASFEKTKADLAKIKLTGIQKLIEPFRAIKTKEEIALIRDSVILASEAFKRLVEVNVRDKTENELSAYLEYQMRLLGAEKISFETILCSGARSSIIHGKPSGNKLQPGDLVIVDFGCVLNSYCSDLTRTCVVGEPSVEQKHWFAVVKEAQFAAAEAARPGTLCRDVDAVARKIISDAGFGEFFSHGLGHGVGLQVHEAPQIGPSSEGTLEAGMIVTIEPGIYFEGKAGLRLEDDFVIGEAGAIRVADVLGSKLFVLDY
ncbi:aminopeptidase P family protein [bacterium]|nr:aminopeptidase P family protein [bacterium]